MRKIILVVIVILLLAGCSSQRGLSRADLCVQRVEDKAQICYGMERAEVEKVAGKGEIAPHGKYLIYNNGLAVNYRDNAVSLIYITEGDYYEHVSGAKIGDLPDELRKKYGTASVDGQGIRDGSIAYDGSSLYRVGIVLNISLITPSAFKRFSDVETAVKESA